VLLLKKFDTLALFCKKDNLVSDLKRLSFIGVSPNSFSLQKYILQKASIPFLNSITPTFFYLLQLVEKLSEKNKR
jgi:hypothetical protein